jgi:hypothetical protein
VQRAVRRARAAVVGDSELATPYAPPPPIEHRWPTQVVGGAAHADVDVGDGAAHDVCPPGDAVGPQLPAGEEVRAADAASAAAGRMLSGGRGSDGRASRLAIGRGGASI